MRPLIQDTCPVQMEAQMLKPSWQFQGFYLGPSMLGIPGKSGFFALPKFEFAGPYVEW